MHINKTFEDLESLDPPRILHSSDNKQRYLGSSGGVVSTLVRYMFDNRLIDAAIGFSFDGHVFFRPKIIFSANEYECTGSIYHEIRLIDFIRKYFSKDVFGEKTVLITCLPCEVKPIKQILTERKINFFLIALFCSAQMTKEATSFLLDAKHINPTEITSFRYRGFGWPSGPQVETLSKTTKARRLWNQIFNSHIFTLSRCFYCTTTFGLGADVAVGDPWLKRYMDTDRLGNTIVLTYSAKGRDVIQDLVKMDKIRVVEAITKEEARMSQLATLKKKFIFIKFSKRFNRHLFPVIRSKTYRKLFKSEIFRIIHNKAMFALVQVLWWLNRPRK